MTEMDEFWELFRVFVKVFLWLCGFWYLVRRAILCITSICFPFVFHDAMRSVWRQHLRRMRDRYPHRKFDD